MNALAKKIGTLLPELEARGDVYLFALAEREDVDRWDVVLSSSWSDESYTSAIRVVADAIVALLTPSELGILAGVRIIPSNEPDILEIPSSLEEVKPEEEKLINVPMTGLDIRRMFIFKAVRPQNMGAVNHAEAVAGA